MTPFVPGEILSAARLNDAFSHARSSGVPSRGFVSADGTLSAPSSLASTTGAGGGGIPCRIYDNYTAGATKSGLAYIPAATVRVAIEFWDEEAKEWVPDLENLINAYPLHAGTFAVASASGCGCGLSPVTGEPAGLVLSWRAGIIYDTDDPDAWTVGGWCQVTSDVEIRLDAGSWVAATINLDGTFTGTLDLSASSRGVHTISAREKFFGDISWQTIRSHCVFRENAEADPTLRKALAPRSIAHLRPDVQDAYDLGASNNDNRTSHQSPLIDCAIADPGASTTHYGRLYLSQAGASVLHDELDNIWGSATEEGDIAGFGTGSVGSEAEADLTMNSIYWVQAMFWGVGGIGLGLTTDDMHSGFSAPMALWIDAEETGEGVPTRYHLRGVLTQAGEDYHLQDVYRCSWSNSDEENTALDA